MTQLAHYYFSPAVRRGLASAITADATGPRAIVQVRAQVVASGGAGDDKKDVSQDVHLYGPGDVLGFSAHAVARTDPRPLVGDFEPNYLVTIDFADPDFPWRYSPLKPGKQGSLRPWIALVVLEKSEFQSASKGEKGLPPTISVVKGCLPSVDAASMWAHVQLTGNDGVSVDPQAHGAALTEAEESAPESVVSRLICPRRLKPNTPYQAFVVPTFKLGCAAAGVAQMGSGESPLAPAWTAGADVTLPCYYSWEFSTGQQGDFEYLVRLLQPRVLTGLGVRPIDCAAPGYGMPAVERTDAAAAGRAVLEMEGALRSIDTKFSPWGKDDSAGKPSAFQQQLADQLLNKYARELAAAKGASGGGGGPIVPSVVPPIYGSWFAARKTVDPARNPTTWLDELNLDPRHRAAAALGTLVVQQQQEALMASAWQQLGEIEKANAVLRHGQLGREAASSLYKRLDTVPDDHLLHMTAPVHARVRGAAAGEPTFAVKLGASRIPAAALDPALRRMRGPSGPARQAGPTSKGKTDLLERLKSGALAAAGPHPKTAGRTSLLDVTVAHAKASGSAPPPAKSSGAAAPAASTPQHFLEHHIDSALLKQELAAPSALLDLPANVKPAVLRDAACGMLDALAKPAAAKSKEEAKPSTPDVDLSGTAKALKKALDPRATIHQQVLARVQIELPDEAKKLRDQGDPLAPLLASPDFPQPMYEAIRDVSQDLILPGIENVPQNTVALLKTNRRFVEAYMVGLNHAFTGELLWRGAPVGGRFTYFRQFWDVADTLAAENPADEKAERLAREKLKDVKPLTSWGNSRLGENDNRAPGGDHAESLVLLVRGALLKKYPNTLVYAVPAAKLPNGHRVPALPEFVPEKDVQKPRAPTFHGSLAPDLTFFGFAFTEEDARGGSRFPAGIFFVLEERLSEARFGLDEAPPGKAQPMKSWDDLSWGHVGVKPGGYLDGAKPSAPGDAAGLTWGQSSAVMAHILLQKPARIAVHAERILPAKAPPPPKALPPKQGQPRMVVSNTAPPKAAHATISVQPSSSTPAAASPTTGAPPPKPSVKR